MLLAYKDVANKHRDNYGKEEDLVSDICIVAVAGIKDPLRPGIKKAVQQCNEAHVTVRMVTGDTLETAKAIAKDAGILP